MALAVMAGIGDIPDHVEHCATCAAQNSHQRDELPQPPVLEDGPDVRPGCHKGGGDSGNTSDREHDGEPVCGPVDFGYWTSWQVPAHPVPDRFCGWCSGVSGKYGGIHMSCSKGTHPEVKSNRTGSVLATANSPVEGWKSMRTGAVWSPSYW